MTRIRGNLSPVLDVYIRSLVGVIIRIGERWSLIIRRKDSYDP